MCHGLSSAGFQLVINRLHKTAGLLMDRTKSKDPLPSCEYLFVLPSSFLMVGKSQIVPMSGHLKIDYHRIRKIYVFGFFPEKGGQRSKKRVTIRVTF